MARLKALLLVCLVVAACIPHVTSVLVPAADIGYEETISERWSLSIERGENASDKAFPSIGIRSVQSLSAGSDGTALVLGSSGESTVLATSRGVSTLLHWQQPKVPALQPLTLGPDSCTCSVSGAEASGSVVFSEHGVQHVHCAPGGSASRCQIVATLSPLRRRVAQCAATLHDGEVESYFIDRVDGSVWLVSAGALTPVLPDQVNNGTTAWNTSLRATAIAVAPGGGALAIATRDRLFTRPGESTPFTWEWATIETPSGCSGGAISAPVTALLYLGSTELYIGHAFGVQRYSSF